MSSITLITTAETGLVYREILKTSKHFFNLFIQICALKQIKLNMPKDAVGDTLGKKKKKKNAFSCTDQF